MKSIPGLCWLMLAICPPAHAGGMEQLRAFLADTKSARAAFVQTVSSTAGRKPQESSGQMVIARPGKFRWSYEKPYQQILVSDGAKLWTYDKDLEQVTVRKVGDALSGSPAALLSGDALERNFELKDLGTVDGLETVEATPKDKNSTFQSLRLGFADNLPKQMEVRDNFGQLTLLVFSNIQRNPMLSTATFAFVPPKGVDVIGE